MYICCLQSLSLSKRKTTHLYICCKLSLLCTHHYEAIHHLLLDREEIIPCTEGQCCHLEEKTQFNQQPQRGTALFDLCVLLYSSRGGGLCWGIPPTLQWNVPQGCASPGKISGGKNDTEGIQIGLVLRKKEEGDRKGTAFLFFYSVNDLKPISWC